MYQINQISLELNFSNYVTKSDLKNATGFDTSDFLKRAALASLKLDIETIKLETTPTDLGKLSNVKTMTLLKRLYMQSLIQALSYGHWTVLETQSLSSQTVK